MNGVIIVIKSTKGSVRLNQLILGVGKVINYWKNSITKIDVTTISALKIKDFL